MYEKPGKVDTVHFDPDTARYYELSRASKEAPIGFVVRLTTDGDDLLPCSRVVIIQATPSPSRDSERKSSAPVQKTLSVREQNDMAAKAVLSGMGYTGPFTREVRNAALMMIEIEKNTLQRLERAKSTKPRKSGQSRKPKKSGTTPS